MSAEKVFQKLLVFNSTRGIDSTGAASVKRALDKGNLQIAVAKELGHPFNLFDITRKEEQDWSDVMSGTSRALLGHCRSSTRGKSSRSNAHPFWHDNIIGTHNGTLAYQTHNSLDGSKKFDTDSESIFYSIEHNGVAETVNKFKDSSDAYALVWYNAEDNTINFLRNDKRPLYYAYSKNHEMIFWSSECDHLRSAMNDVEHDDEKYLMVVPTDMHLSWVIPSHGQKFEKVRMVRREQPKATGNFTQATDFKKGHGGNGTNGPHAHSGYTSTGKGTGTKWDYNKNTWSNENEEVKPEGLAFFDRSTGFFCKFVNGTNKYRYSKRELGTYYDTIEECWENLLETEKNKRIADGEVPLVVANRLASGMATKAATPSTWTVISGGKEELNDPLPSMSDNAKNVKDSQRLLLDKELEKVLEFRSMTPIFLDHMSRVYWDFTKKLYHNCFWKGFKDGWAISSSKTCPAYVPFTDLDIQARHQFKHEGKPGKKVSMFRGFRSDLLVKSVFEKKMESGCLDCERKPKWGNDVTFLSHDRFLCEYCSKDLSNITQWKELVKKYATT